MFAAGVRKGLLSIALFQHWCDKISSIHHAFRGHRRFTILESYNAQTAVELFSCSECIQILIWRPTNQGCRKVFRCGLHFTAVNLNFLLIMCVSFFPIPIMPPARCFSAFSSPQISSSIRRSPPITSIHRPPSPLFISHQHFYAFYNSFSSDLLF